MSSDSSDHSNRQKKKKRSRHKRAATALPPAEPSPTPQPAPWRSTQFQLVDGVNRYRAGQQEVDGTIMLYGDVGGHMCSFAQLTDYSREAFRIDREILFIFNTGVHTSRPAGTQLSPRHSSHVPRVPQAHSISDETQLESFRLSINAPDAAVTLRLLQSTEPIPSRRTLTVPALDFSGSGTLNRSDFLSQLKKAIYPGTGQHRAGALCEEAVRLLAANPDRLLAFDQLRELVCLVTGNELLLLTPVSFLCPLHGRGCRDGQVMLFNDNTLRGLEQHLRLAHRDEERAGHLLARLVYAREHPYCSAAELTERAGPFELQPSDRRQRAPTCWSQPVRAFPA